MKIIYPNHHTPNEYRSSLPKPLEAALAVQKNLVIKKIIPLYFSQINEHVMFDDHGIKVDGEYITIPAGLLSDRAGKRGLSATQEAFHNLASEVENSVVKSRKISKQENDNSLEEAGKGLLSNLWKITMDEERQLRGRVDGAYYDVKYVNLLQEVSISHGSITVRMSPFLQDTRKYLTQRLKEAKSNYDKDWIITASSREVLKFKSAHALQLYYMVARAQMDTNFLILSIDEFCKQLNINYRGPNEKEIFRRTLNRITSDPVLLNSTCKLLPQNIKGKTLYYSHAKRNRGGVTHIRLNFQRNDELKASLLAETSNEFEFINHLRDKYLNESTLVQIIARVKDNIISYRWINYCINKAYDHVNESRNLKQYPSIGPLVWEYIKSKNFETVFEHDSENCVLSKVKGMSINMERKSKEPVQLEMGLNAIIRDGGGLGVWNYLKSLTGLEYAYIDYAKNFMTEDQFTIILNHKRNSVSTESFIVEAVLQDFKFKFKDEISVALLSIGCSVKKTDLLLRIMDQEALSTIFSYLDNKLKKIKIPPAARLGILEHMDNLLQQLSSIE